MNTYFVDPDSDDGGDGTTPDLTGEHCAFRTRALWAAIRVNGLTLSDIERCEVRSSGASHTADYSACTLSGATTSSTAYAEIYVHPDHRHQGVPDTTKAQHNVRAWNLLNYTRIIGEHKNWNGTQGYHGFYDTHAATGVLIDSCLVSVQAFSCAGFYLSSSYGTHNNVVQNCIAYDCTYGFLGGTIWTFLNCTAVNNTYRGFSLNAGGATVKNCFAVSDSDNQDYCDFGHGSSSTVTYSASGDATADDMGGTGTHTNHTFTMQDPDNNNYLLDSSDEGAKGLGTTSGAPSVDIAGNTRGSTVDLGAHNVSSE